MSAFIDAVCEREFGDAPVHVDHLATGNVKETSVVELADGSSVVVQWSDADLGDEALVLRRIGRRTDVPVPRVLSADTLSGRSYFVTEFVPGVNLHGRLTSLEADVRRELIGELGMHLASVHDAFRFDGHGAVVNRGGELAVERPQSWRQYVRGLLDDGLADLPHPLSELRDRIDSAFDPGALPQDPTPRLYPWDYRPGNVLVDDGAVAAALDWGEPRTAHRELSVVKSEYCTVDWYGQEEFRDAFYEGYESASRLDDEFRHRRRQYRIVAIVRSAVTQGGSITRPGYPMVDTSEAIAFHRRALEPLL